MNKFIFIQTLLLSAVLSSCKPQLESIDVTSGATVPHDQIVLPPANNDYRILGHLNGLNNYVVEYSDTFYRGGEIYNQDLALKALKKHGIKTIISIAPSEKERVLCASYGIALVEIPFGKEVGPSAADYEKYFQTLKTREGSFYIHCIGGSHRAGIFSAAYRIRLQGWSFNRAIIEYARLGGDLKVDHAMLETLRTITQEKAP